MQRIGSKLILAVIIMLIAFCMITHAYEVRQGIQELPQESKDESWITSDQFSYSLIGNLKDVSDAILVYSGVNEIDPILVASIAALESGWNTSYAANEYNNLFGWTNNDGTYKRFESKDECIKYVCEQLKEHYLTSDGKYFEGYEIADICVHYNGREEWTQAIEELYEQIQNKVDEYNYYKIVNISISSLQMLQYMI